MTFISSVVILRGKSNHTFSLAVNPQKLLQLLLLDSAGLSNNEAEDYIMAAC